MPDPGDHSVVAVARTARRTHQCMTPDDQRPVGCRGHVQCGDRYLSMTVFPVAYSYPDLADGRPGPVRVTVCAACLPVGDA